MKIPIIKTKQAILRPLRRNDSRQLVKYANNKKVSRFTRRMPYPYRKKDAEKFIKETLREHKKRNPKAVRFVIEHGNELIGMIGIDEIEKGHRAEIGYWIGEPFWGRGIVTEAVKKLTAFGFKELDLHRIRAGVFKRNIASQRVLEKSGFQKEGLQRKNTKKGNKFYDTYLYAKVR